MDTKSKHTHTPGPWGLSRVEHSNGTPRNTVNVNGRGWFCFASVYVRLSGHKEDSPEGLANARLIAAAPDLLEALKETRCHANNYLHQVNVQIIAQGPHPYESFLTQRDRAAETLRKADAAIAKAQPPEPS